MSNTLGKGNSVGIRSEFQEIPAAVFTSGNTSNSSVAASSSATAVRLISLKQMSKAFFVDNSTNQKLTFVVVTPEDKTRTRTLWFSLAGGRSLNLELASNNLSIEAGLEVWVYASGTIPTLGDVSMFTWG